MRKAFRTRTFTRWMRKAGLTDAAPRKAVSEMAVGLVDADLGGHLVKKRVALPDQGRRGGARTIVATKWSSRWFFLYEFGQNERASVSGKELKALPEIATVLLELDDRQVAAAMAAGEIAEVIDDDDPT